MPRKNHLIILLTRADAKYEELNYLCTLNNLQNILSGKFESAIVFKRGREYIALLSSDRDNLEAELPQTLSFCKNAVMRSEKAPFNIGCSIPSDRLIDMAECYIQAKRAIQFGHIVDASQNTFWYRDYYELELIARGIDSTDAESFKLRIHQSHSRV